jgi:hypothetical protein
MAPSSQDWRRYRALPPAKRQLLREALLRLLLARAALALVPFRRLAAWLGEPGAESGPDVSEEQRPVVEDVAWAVQAMARRVPWDSRCLAQAFAAYRMLRRRGIAATVYFGVRKDPAVPFKAHAWLRCGPRIVTGEAGHEAYRVLGQFSHGAGSAQGPR